MKELLENKYVLFGLGVLVGNSLGYLMYSPASETSQIGEIKEGKKKKKKFKNKDDQK